MLRYIFLTIIIACTIEVSVVLAAPISTEESTTSQYQETTLSLDGSDETTLAKEDSEDEDEKSIFERNMKLAIRKYLDSMSDVYDPASPYIDDFTLKARHLLAAYKAKEQFVIETSNLESDFLRSVTQMILEHHIEERFHYLNLENQSKYVEKPKEEQPFWERVSSLLRPIIGI